MTNSEQCKVVAQRLLCALDTYEASFSAWAATPSLLDFSRVDTQMDRVRLLRVLLPQVSDEMAGVVTAHAELGTMHIRDRTGTFGKQHSSEELASARTQHSTAIDAVRKGCCRLLSDSDAGLTKSETTGFAVNRSNKAVVAVGPGTWLYR